MSKRPLKVIGTSVTLPEQLRRRALRDLAFPIEFDVLDGISCQQRGITSPGSFDVYDQWFHSIDLLWTAGSVQPIETRRIRRWNEVSLHSGPVARLAATTPLATGSSGMRPSDLLFVQEDNTLGPAPTPTIAMLPTTYNVDSFAYAPDIAAPLGFAAPESWAWLLDERWHGRCTLSKDPAASTVELALAARSAGLVDIADPCNLSIEEIDALVDLVMARRPFLALLELLGGLHPPHVGTDLGAWVIVVACLLCAARHGAQSGLCRAPRGLSRLAERTRPVGGADA